MKRLMLALTVFSLPFCVLQPWQLVLGCPKTKTNNSLCPGGPYVVCEGQPQGACNALMGPGPSAHKIQLGDFSCQDAGANLDQCIDDTVPAPCTWWGTCKKVGAVRQFNEAMYFVTMSVRKKTIPCGGGVM